MAFPYRKAKPDNLGAFIVQSIREDWPFPEKYLEEQARQLREVEAKQQQAETQKRFDRYKALYNKYLDEKLGDIQKSDPERWGQFVKDTETRQQHILAGVDPSMIDLANDWAEMVRYNALPFFGASQQYGFYFMDDWIQLQEEVAT